MYLTFEEYTDMGGTLEESAFNDLEFDAESTINWYTFNRLKRPEWADVLSSPELKRCMYQLIKLKAAETELLASSGGGAGWGVGWAKEAGITEESNDGVTTKYNTASAGDMLAFFRGSKTVNDVVQQYMGSIVNDLGRNILYRGVYRGE